MGEGVRFDIGEGKNISFFKLENFQKMLKIYEKMIIFGKFGRKIGIWKNLSKISRQFMEKI